VQEEHEKNLEQEIESLKSQISALAETVNKLANEPVREIEKSAENEDKDEKTKNELRIPVRTVSDRVELEL